MIDVMRLIASTASFADPWIASIFRPISSVALAVSLAIFFT